MDLGNGEPQRTVSGLTEQDMGEIMVRTNSNGWGNHDATELVSRESNLSALGRSGSNGNASDSFHANGNGNGAVHLPDRFGGKNPLLMQKQSRTRTKMMEQEMSEEEALHNFQAVVPTEDSMGLSNLNLMPHHANGEANQSGPASPLVAMKTGATIALNKLKRLGSQGGNDFSIRLAPVSPYTSILITDERREIRERRKKKSKRPRRVHFKLPRKRDVQMLQVLDPNSDLYVKWLMIMVCPLAYEQWAFPFRLAFGLPGTQDIYVVLGDLISDFCMLIDMMFSLVTAIPAGTYPDQHEQINTFSGIAATYFRRVFPYQMLPIGLYWVATLSLAGQSGWMIKWIWWAASLPRMLTRLTRMQKYFRSMETNLDVSVRTLQAVKFALIIFLSCHWVGLFYYFLSRLRSFDNTTWVHDFETLLPLYNKVDDALSTHYLLCLYKGFNAMSNLAYDYGLPKNSVEMIWSLFVMALQVYMSALILGTLLNYLVHKDPVAEAHKKRMEIVTQFMDTKQIPAELRDRILKHFQFQHEKNVENKAAASVQLPRSLEIKVADAKYRAIIDKCAARGKLLGGCNPQFLNALLVKLKVVHVMAGEEVVKKDEIARELYFVLDGTLHIVDDDNRVKKVIRNDVPDMPPVAGDVPFFLGVNHPYTIRARPDGNIQLLVLDKEDSVEIAANYPEEYELISINLLAAFDLDINGREAKSGMEDADDGDPDKAALKLKIVDAMKVRAEQRFVQLIQHTDNGDVEAVMLAARKGADINQKNYDGRTILHMACAEGNYKLVEVLLEHGADKNVRDRWNQTPMAEAILNRQSLVVGLLTSHRADLAIENPASVLCEYAQVGDVAQVKKLVENKVRPDVADYDGRTALHIAASEGQDKVVEYLLQAKASPNVEDRWLGTPLQDAILNGNSLTASLIRAKGGQMPKSSGSDEACSAAGNGDVKKLRLLHECGQSMDCGDYDSRFPLHLAAAEARILAVSYLLGLSTDPNCKDRWGGTPLDDALRGGTLYHLFCGKLIAGWGGELGVLEGTEYGNEMMAKMNELSIKQVRLVIKDLIAKGYDKDLPPRISDSDLKATHEATIALVPGVRDLRNGMLSMAEKIKRIADQIKMSTSDCRDTVYKLTMVMNMKRVKNPLKGNMNGNAFGSSKVMSSTNLSVLGSARWSDMDTVANGNYDGSMVRRGSMESMEDMPLTSATGNGVHRRSSLENGDAGRRGSIVDAGVGSPTQATTQNLIAECQSILAAQENEEQSFNPQDDINEDVEIDSDEEAQLYAELDALLEAMERAAAAGQSGEKMAARTFQRAALHLVDVESMFETLVNACSLVQHGTSVVGAHQEPNLTMEEIGRLLETLGLDPEIQFDIEDMFEEADSYMWTFGLKGKRLEYESKSKPNMSASIHGALNHDAQQSTVTIEALLAGSSSFRKAVLGIKTNPILCSVMKTRVGKLFTETQARSLIQNAREKVIKADDMAYEGSNPSRHYWCVVITGELDIEANDQDTKYKILGPGDFFGAYGHINDMWPRVNIKAKTDCNVLELDIEALLDLVRTDDGIMRMVTDAMGEAVKEDKKEKRGTNSPNRAKWMNGMGQSFMLKKKGKISIKNVVKDQKFKVLRSFVSHVHDVRTKILAEEDRRQLVEMLQMIVEVWKNFSMGAGSVSMSQISAVGNQLGEVASECFKRMFLDRTDMPDTVTEMVFWHAWVTFLAASVYGQGAESFALSRAASKGDDERRDEDVTAQIETIEEYDDDDVGIFEKLHARFAPSRSLRHRFFEDDVIEQYEPIFEQVVGNLKEPLKMDKMPTYLAHLFVDFPYRITSHNCKEFLEVFLKERSKDASSIIWPDIRKVLRERRMGIWVEDGASRLFIGGAINPQSHLLKRFRTLIKLVGVYFFVMVPVRACFLPWDSMLDIDVLALDLPFDTLSFLNAIIMLNTAYQNSRSMWITDRTKILRRSDFSQIFSSLPLDWFAWACGASNEACCWLRLNKMMLLVSFIRASSQSLEGRKGLLKKMVYMVAMTLHLSACCWYFLGVKYVLWYPKKAISWYAVDDQLQSLTYDRSEHFAMIQTASSWDRYLLSLYWVSATLTVNGLIGEAIPQNLIEIMFTIFLMTLNMTMVRWILGEVSTIIMSADNDVVKAREELEAVDAFISGNAFPDELKKEIRLHFRAARSGASVDQAEVFQGLSHGLKVEVASFISREYLDGVDLLHGCSEQMLDALSVMLLEVTFAAEEYLFRTGETSGEMYFVVSGSVEELIDTPEGEAVDEIKKVHNSVGGIASFFGLRHFHSARASKLAGATCFRLLREQFFDMLKIYPLDEEVLAQNAMRSFDKVKNRAGSRREGSRAGGSVASGSKSGKSDDKVSSVLPGSNDPGTDKQDGKSKTTAEKGGEQDEQDEEIATEAGDSDDGGDSDGIGALMGGTMKDKINALKNRRRKERINLLLTAAAAGDIRRLTTLVTGDIQVNDTDGYKRTALHVAASEGHLEMVQLLLEMRADITLKDKFQNTPMNDAVRHKHDEIARFVRQTIPGTRMTLPGCAAACMMCEFASTHDLESIKRLLENGINVNEGDYDGRTGLHLASCEGAVEIVRYLIDNGANIECLDRFNGTPLEDAVRHNQVQVQEILRTAGADLKNCGTNYSVKLCEYAAEGDLEKIKTLATNGVALDLGDYDQRTCLHLAASNERVSVLEYLINLEPKIDVNMLDRFGGTSADDARRHGQSTALAMLQQAGGLSKGDTSLDSVLEQQTIRNEKRFKEMRAPQVQKLVKHAPEQVALQWVQSVVTSEFDAKCKDLDTAILRLMRGVQGASLLMSERKVTQRLSSGEFGVTANQVINVDSNFNVGLVLDSATMSRDVLTSNVQVPVYSDLEEAAQSVTELAVELKKVVLEVRGLMDAERSEGSGESGSKECRIWQMAQRKYQEECSVMNLHLRSLLELVRICRRLMKEVLKSNRRNRNTVKP